MTTIKQIYDFLNDFAPFENSLSFDNTGLLIGNFETEVKKALVALDITSKVIDEAVSMGANLIITKQPIIFKPLKNLKFDDIASKMIINGINAICAHTNLDVAPKGVNFQLAKRLNLSNLIPLTHEENQPMGLVGTLEKEMAPKEFAEFVKENLECNGLRYTGTNRKIKKVGVCSGSGGCFVKEAKKQHCDAFVTGEIKHSDILLAGELDLMIVDAGHYKTENVIIEPLCNELSKRFKDVDFATSKKFTDNINYL